MVETVGGVSFLGIGPCGAPHLIQRRALSTWLYESGEGNTIRGMTKTPDPRQEDGRRGAIFSMRISDDDRRLLELREKQSREVRGYTQTRRYRSLGGFLVWAALQWKPAQGQLWEEQPGPLQRKKRAPRKPKHAKRPRKGITKGRGRGGKKVR